MDTRTAGTGWAAPLRDFTRRTAGRPTRLEIDDPELGAQWREIGLPLRGVDHDPREGSSWAPPAARARRTAWRG